MKTVDVKIPSVGESIAQVTMGQWLKKSGEWVAMDSALCELESDKASVELSAPVSGILEIVAEAGSTQAIAAVVARIKEQAAPAAGQNAPAAPAPLPEVKTQQTATASNSNIASPAAAKMLRESPDLAAQVAASGKDGRVTKQDVLAAAAAGPVQPKLALVTPAANTGAAQSSSETASKAQRKPMTTMRKTIAKRLLAAKNQTAMLTTFNEVDMFQLMELRKKYKDQFKERHQVGLGFMSLFTKAVCVALERFPVVGAFIDGEDIVYPGHTSIGVAVSTEKGLMVPVVRQAGHLALWQIEKEIARLALKARDGKLSIDDMQGGVFTITNGGVFGSMLSTPILNAPQSAILGMHNIVERPWVVNGQIVIRPIMYLALSYDHRLIDGKDSVSFLKTVKELIEDPARLLLEV